VKWVTRRNVGVDRIGCAWLVYRFIDPDAEFVFAPQEMVANVPNAEPFDVPGVRLSHHGGHSTFHTILREYDLADPVLERIARIVDEADTPQEVMIESAAPGLGLICGGLRLISNDDRDAIVAGRVIYDALYAELRHE
jgi:hypothetical protein